MKYSVIGGFYRWLDKIGSGTICMKMRRGVACVESLPCNAECRILSLPNDSDIVEEAL